MAGKHIPQRTCIACHTVRGKREFVRIVRIAEGRVEADPTGKKSGRGAYLCRQRECWDEALSTRGHLEHALKMEQPIDAADLARLREYGATLPPRTSSPREANPSSETAPQRSTRPAQSAGERLATKEGEGMGPRNAANVAIK